MTFWQPRLEGRSGPTYRIIAEALAEDIQIGVLAAGTRLPPQRQLADHLGVAIGTISRAYTEGQRLGLLTGEIGRGTFIRGAADDLSTLGERDAVNPGVIDFSLNYPPSSGIESGVVGAALCSIGERGFIGDLLGYQHRGGTPGQLDAAAMWLGFGDVSAKPEEILLTNGVQHGLAAALAAVCEPGDTVAAEALSYPGIRALAMMQHLRIKGLAMDEGGLLPDAFEAACAGGSLRVLYTIPTVHNPTTASLSIERREAIIEIARRYNVLLVEDDIYGFLLPDALPTLRSLAPDRTVYLSSVSKLLAPGLRVGFAVPPTNLRTKIAAMIRSTVWMAAPPMVECFRIMVESGDAARVAASRQAEALARQEMAAEILADYAPVAHRFGSHLWLRLPPPWTSQDFVSQARQRGVLVLAEEAFAVTRPQPEHHVRVCLGCPASRNEVNSGLEVVADTLRQNPDILRMYI